MMTLADIGKQIKTTTEALAKADAELKWELAASAADVAGMIDPTPTSDLIGAGLAVRKGDWLGAGMSVASMVPYVGDALAKPAKAVRATKRINELRQTITKLTAKLADLRKAEKEGEAAAAIAAESRLAKNTTGGIGEKTVKQTADGQKTAAKGGKDRDCEDCASSGRENSRANNKVSHLPVPEVECFHPYNKKKFARLNSDAQRAYLQEMSKQLRRQEDAINQMTANEFAAARQAFNAKNRNPAAKARQASMRDDYTEEIYTSIFEGLRRKMGRKEASAAARKKTEDVMEKLAALHEPDMVVGGWHDPTPVKMGRSDINSSIGAAWNKAGRAQALHDAATKAVNEGQGDELMNVRLEVCRGKGKR